MRIRRVPPLSPRTKSPVLEGGRRSMVPYLLLLQAHEPDAISPAVPGQASRVRAKLARGRLRSDPCTGGTVVALGSRLACHGCDEPIPVDEVELRAHFADRQVLRFHARCFAAWQTEIAE